MNKICVVQLEQMIDGEVFFDIFPCVSEKIAKKEMKKIIEEFLNQEKEYEHYEEEDFENVDKTETSYFIKAATDDYYFNVSIIEKDIIK